MRVWCHKRKSLLAFTFHPNGSYTRKVSLIVSRPSGNIPNFQQANPICSFDFCFGSSPYQNPTLCGLLQHFKIVPLLRTLIFEISLSKKKHSRIRRWPYETSTLWMLFFESAMELSEQLSPRLPFHLLSSITTSKGLKIDISFKRKAQPAENLTGGELAESLWTLLQWLDALERCP